jgi:ankyrin repeat protein
MLLKNGVDVDMKDQFTGLVALNMACRLGHFVVARLLVDSGAAINGRGENETDNHHRTTSIPLLDAIEGDNTELARWLVEKGADISNVRSDGTTALWSACYMGNETIVRMLIDRGAEVNVPTSRFVEIGKMTALETAEFHRHSAIVRLLKYNGASY